MQITICDTKYEIDDKQTNLLKVLEVIKSTLNNTLVYKSGCKSGVCGCCSVRVNGIERLACKTTIKDNDTIEPLNNLEVIRDLVVNTYTIHKKLKQADAVLQNNSKTTPTIDNIINIDKETNCILCNSCYSICPVFSANSDFVGPYALVRAYRYIKDTQNNDKKPIIDAIQTNGVFDCTLCGYCNTVCPSLIDIKNDITQLQNYSVQFGYTNTNFTFNSMSF